MDASVDDEEIVHGASTGARPRRLAFRHLLTPEGFVAERALVLDATGTIVAIEPGEAPWAGWCALPAMVDAHSHAFHHLLTGLGERAATRATFWSWRELMYRAAERLEPEDLELVATVAYEALRLGGYATVGEFHYLHRGRDGRFAPALAEALVRAANRVGVRLVLIPALYRRGGYDRPLEGAQWRFSTPDLALFLDHVAMLPTVVRAIAIHSLRAVEPEVAERFVSLARARFGEGCRLHVHAAEQRAEVDEVVRHEGRGPIEVLDVHGLLDERTAVIHATHATPEERSLITQRGARVVLCPSTEAYLGDGHFPLVSFLREGGHWALGSDANVRPDALGELRALEFEARLRDERRVRLVPEGAPLAATLWSRAARDGAWCLGLNVGELRIGCQADLLVVDPADSPWASDDPARFLDACLVGDPGRAFEDVRLGGIRRAPLAVRDPIHWRLCLARFRR
ncbi:MAG: amidohydrolase family protein, partial [Candidatus Micrarchaeaceae archaeon]